MELNDAVEQYIQRATNLFKGQACNFAQAGGYVWVRVGSRTLRARAGSIINSTEVAVAETGGEYVAFCSTAPIVTRSTMDRFVKSRVDDVEEAIGNIMYAYLTRGDAPDTTALYVAGFADRRSIKVDEWSNGTSTSGSNIGQSTYGIQLCCLDNLGGGNFIISYTMTKFDDEANTIYNEFKCFKSNGGLFSLIINWAGVDGLVSLASGGWAGLGGQYDFFIASVGFGNWVSSEIRVLDVQSSTGGASTTTVTTVEGIRVSDLSINPRIGSAITRNSFSTTRVTTSIASGGGTSSEVGTYAAYISPSFTTTGVYSVFADTTSFTVNSRHYQPTRYNARLDKGIFSAIEHDLNIGGMGVCQNGSFYIVPFVQNSRVGAPGGTMTRLPVMADFQCTATITNGSPTAIVQSGVIPAVNTPICSIGIPDGTYVTAVSGSTLTLSRNATQTSTQLFSWAFPSTQSWSYPSIQLDSKQPSLSNWNRYTGTEVQCDIQSDGFSVIYSGGFTSRFGGLNTILTEKIKFPVSFYGNDFRYRRSDLVTIYPPGVVKNNSQNIPLFRILAASYSEGTGS